MSTIGNHTQNQKGKNMPKVAIWIIAMVLVGSVGIFGNEVKAFGYGDYPPPIYGDWIISIPTVVENETIILNGNLTINNGGSLTFENVILIMNCGYDGQYGIYVNSGGEFHILDYDNDPSTTYDKSRITANNPNYEFKFLVNEGAVFEMRNSELSECGYEEGKNGESGLTIYTTNSIIEYNSIHDNDYWAIHVGTSSQNAHTNTITYNEIYNNNFGIHIYYSSYNIITYNSVHDNNYGIYLDDVCNNNNVLYNTIYNSGDFGIMFHSSDNNYAENNTVYSNGNDGIYVWDSDNNYIINNTIYDDGEYGIYFAFSNNNQLKNDIIHDNNYGIYLDYPYTYSKNSNNTIDNCNIYDNIQNEIYFKDTINTQIINSTISNINSQLINIFMSSNSQNNSVINTTFSTIYVDSSSQLIIKNYLEVLVQDVNGELIENAIVSVKDNDNEVFNGTTNSEGLCSWILITDKIYDGSSTATENTTTVQVFKEGFTFANNPRDVNMANSHRETFQSNEEMPEFNSLIILIILLIGLFFMIRRLKRKE